MAEAWNKAKAYLDSIESHPEVIKENEFKVASKKGNFKHGNFNVNGRKSTSNGIEMSMDMYKEIDTKRYEIISSFAKKRNLTVKDWACGVYLYNSDGKYVGEITNVKFSATTPEIFEAIGKEVYGLRTKGRFSFKKN